MTPDDSDSSSDSSSSDIGCSGDSDHGYQGHSYGFSSDYPDDDSSPNSTPEENLFRQEEISSNLLKVIASVGFMGLCIFGGVKTGSYVESQLQINDPSRDRIYGCSTLATTLGGTGGFAIGSAGLFLYWMNKKKK